MAESVQLASDASVAGSGRFARAPHLWALGVGAVISGDFFGWQSALVAGFDGLLVILSVVTVLYLLLSFSIAELSTSLPSGGGPYVFALHGIGRKAAFFAGLAESLKVIMTCSVIAVGIGSYLNELMGLSSSISPLWWIGFYILFCGLNIWGIEVSFRVQFITTLLAMTLLVVFYFAAISHISYSQWVEQQNWKFVDGMDGLLKGFSFSLWFYLGIEELPLAVEETIDPSRNMPLGLFSAIVTLMGISFCTVVFNSMISPGAKAISESSSPLLVGYKTVFGDNHVTSAFSWLLVVGLICSFHSFIYCMGKLLHAIARDGYFPSFLTKTHPQHNTPHAALITGSSIGLCVALLLHFIIDEARLGSVLINLSLIGALVSYAFQLTAFIRLRFREPDRERPFKSWFGVPGAVACLVLCGFVLFTIVYNGVENKDFLASLVAAALFFGFGAVYFVTRVKPQVQLEHSRASLLSCSKSSTTSRVVFT